jgi:hypothetical protein
MKSPVARALSIAAVFLLPVLAHAHPGHDGDHDFVWDFGHLVSNPLATIVCLTLLGTAIWGVRHLLRSRPAPKAKRLKRD